MSGIAALAAKGAMAASGVSVTWLPRIAPSAVDGFAVGALLSGLCFLMVVAPKRALRRRRGPARDALRAGVAAGPARSALAPPGRRTQAAPGDPFADESAEIVVSTGSSQLLDEVGREPKAAGHQSRHRAIDPDGGDRRLEIRRSAGRHAAPSTGSRVAGRRSVDALSVRD